MTGSRVLVRGGRPARLRAQAIGLLADRLEIGIAIAKRHAALTDWRAAIGLTIDATVHRDKCLGRTFDLDLTVHQDLAETVHGDEICGAVALPGHHDDTAILQRDIGN